MIVKPLTQLFSAFGDFFPDIKVRRYITVIALIGTPFLFWFIESQTKLFFFWYLKRKVEIFSSLVALSDSGVINGNSVNSDLLETYKQILLELNSQRYLYFPELSSYIFNTIESSLVYWLTSVVVWKFLSGSVLSFVLGIYLFFFGEGKDRRNALVGGMILSIFFGLIGILLPVIFKPIINYTVFPIIQISILLVLGQVSKS